MHIAQVAPLTEAIPPKLYGGTERVVSWHPAQKFPPARKSVVVMALAFGEPKSSTPALADLVFCVVCWAPSG
jgi:hypothetical protein